MMQPPEFHDARRHRTPMSCSECSRRKIRCDKRVPCRACWERGDGDECRPRQLPSKRPRTNLAGAGNGESDEATQAQVQAELSALRSRLDEVEAVLNIKCRDGSNPQNSHGQGDGHDFHENGLAGAIEEAALGIGQNQRWHGAALLEDRHHPSLISGQSSSWYSSIPLQECLSTLPPRIQSQVLLEFYCDRLDWMFGCLHRATITRQHDTFWNLYDQGQLEDGMTVALIFSVLSVSSNFFDDHDMYAFMPEPQELQRCAVVWFNCALATLFRCDGLTRPSLLTCQCITTLSFSFNLSGNTPIHGTMSHMLIRMARSMNLHLLGSDRSGPDEQVLSKELGRRVWWQIVEVEWSFLPYHRYTSIAPHHFDTCLPALDDHGQIQDPSSPDCHSLSFLLTSCRSSQVLYELYGTLRPSEHPSYQAVLSASQKLDSISDELPRELKKPAQFGPARPSPVVMSRYLGMMLAYRSYLIHRAYFVKSLQDNAYQESRIACVSAAETIVSYAQNGLPPSFYKLWTTTLWLVSAGIVLALDLFHISAPVDSSRSTDAQRQKLDSLLDLLRSVNDQSGIGSRGAKLIAHLCSTQRKVRPGTLKPFTSRQDIIDLIQTAEAAPRGKKDGGDGRVSGGYDEQQHRHLGLDQSLGGSSYDAFYEDPSLFLSLPEGLSFLSESPTDMLTSTDFDMNAGYLRNLS